MSALTDQMLLLFLQDVFVEDLLKSQLGLLNLLNLMYNIKNIKIREIDLAGLENRQFLMPIFETIYITGTKEQIRPTSELDQINYAQRRQGRLAWVEVFLKVLLSTKVEVKSTPIESIRTKSLVEELGGVNSLEQLKTKLQAKYSESVVEAFFQKLRISSLEEFQQKESLFLEIIYKNPPPFDPNDPKNISIFPINLCIKFQEELKLAESLQAAKIVRSILENEKIFRDVWEGEEIKNQYIFVTIFPDSLTSDAQMKNKIKEIFIAENMLAHFLLGI